MGLSRDLERRLFEVFVERTRESKDHGFDYGQGPDRFCPGCGVKFEPASTGRRICPRCHQGFGEFVYVLTEFHPHRRTAS
jgi:hypothetical protein